MESQNILSRLPAAVYRAVVEIKGRSVRVREVEFLTDWVERITGWSREEIRSDPEWCVKNIHPDDLEGFFSDCERLSGQGEVLDRFFRFRRKDGGYTYIHDTVIPVRSDGNLVEVVGVWEDATREREFLEIFDALNNAPEVGVLIYRGRIVYANRAAVNILGYPEEELKNMSVEDLVSPEMRERVREIARRRVSGERFEMTYQEIPVITRDRRIKIVFAFSRTILWAGEPAGFVIFVDITKRRKYERMFSLLKELNRLVVSAMDQTDLLKEVARLLVERAGFRMVWVGIVNRENGEVVPVCVYGHDDGYVKNLKISLSEDVPEGRGPTGKALREGRIVVNPDTRTNPDVEPWREEMLKRNYLSSCAIPVMKGGKVFGVVNIYSQTPGMFTDEELDLLKEVQKDLSFAMDRIARDKHMKLISIAVEKAHDWFLITDEDGTILYVNPAVEKISGYTADYLVGKNPRVFKSGYHSEEFYRELWETIKSGKVFEAVFVNRRRDGEIFYLDQTIVPIRFRTGETRFVAIGRDITSERRLREEIARIRYIDVVTDLPNRDGFLAGVEMILEREKDKNHLLLILDLRNFASMNQFYGTSVGDEILRRFAQTLKQNLFRRDIVARVGADEFGVLARNIEEKNITTLMEKILTLVKQPVKVNGKTVILTVNIGASVYPADAKSTTELFEKAYTALSFAKNEGENTYKFFGEEINLMVNEYFRMREKLKRAVEEDRFLLYLQPIYRTDTGKVAGFEALIRLREKDRILTPRDFITTLERTGLIRRVEDTVLERVVDIIGRFEGFFVSFNVSPRSFKDPDFLTGMEEVAREAGSRLILEITERLLVEDLDHTRAFLERVKAMGVRVAVDDFGTGYSSLAYLETLPVDILKIDIKFVHRITRSPKSLAIVETIVNLARRLDME
ncbi:MAG: EAL domain-containing protein, partial [Aquificota bacterium]|nr:EAL domain-containing protein [Aquificota bacterium]